MLLLLSGSGNTAAFLVPIVNAVLNGGCPRVKVSYSINSALFLYCKPKVIVWIIKDLSCVWFMEVQILVVS